MSHAAQRTAFVFAGGGSLGAVQVGMLHELMHAGVSADLVLGSSVGAMNAAYFAGSPHVAGVSKLEEVWRRLRRRDVFPVTFRSVLGFMGGADNLIDPSNLRKLTYGGAAKVRGNSPLCWHDAFGTTRARLCAHNRSNLADAACGRRAGKLAVGLPRFGDRSFCGSGSDAGPETFTRQSEDGRWEAVTKKYSLLRRRRANVGTDLPTRNIDDYLQP